MATDVRPNVRVVNGVVRQLGVVGGDEAHHQPIHRGAGPLRLNDPVRGQVRHQHQQWTTVRTTTPTLRVFKHPRMR